MRKLLHFAMVAFFYTKIETTRVATWKQPQNIKLKLKSFRVSVGGTPVETRKARTANRKLESQWMGSAITPVLNSLVHVSFEEFMICLFPLGR